jgi:hypothetical protein
VLRARDRQYQPPIAVAFLSPITFQIMVAIRGRSGDLDSAAEPKLEAGHAIDPSTNDL